MIKIDEKNPSSKLLINRACLQPPCVPGIGSWSRNCETPPVHIPGAFLGTCGCKILLKDFPGFGCIYVFISSGSAFIPSSPSSAAKSTKSFFSSSEPSFLRGLDLLHSYLFSFAIHHFMFSLFFS